jgi:DNA polymerase-3 subunit alpha
MDFIHIHNHSQYSKFDGFSTIDGIVKKAKKLGMRAVGLTDHGTFAGAISFLKACRKQSIKPILGMEAYQARNCKVHNKEGQPDGRRGNRHINVIAKNYQGLRNVAALSQTASLEGYYYDPRLDWNTLYEHREGLIVTSACLSNVVNWNLSIDRYDHAKKAAAGFKEIFGDDYYLEIMFHGLDKEGRILPLIQKLSKELDIKIIATNDCHYLEQSDAEFHEVLMCMSSGRCIRDPKRIKFPYSEFYFKSQDEMKKVFGHVHRSLSNTIEIAEKCDYSDLIFVEDGGEMRLPRFEIPDKYDHPLPYLNDLAWAGLKNLGLDKSKEHVARLKQELSDIKLIWDTKRYDFATYFLIVEDIMRYAKEKGIAAGIRGSGYGSVLLKSLGICEGVDPLAQDLMWERFLGFDDKYFISENDFGIGGPLTASAEKDEVDTSDPVSIMTDRYK